MLNDLLITGALGLCFLLLFLVAEVLHARMAVHAEHTRKLVHFGTGILTLLFPLLLPNHWYVLFLCSTFFALLLMSLRFDFLKAINKIDRVSYGSLLYPLSVYLCYLGFKWTGDRLMVFYAPVLILAISDPCAALVGRNWPMGEVRIFSGIKTLAGASAFFVSAFLILVLLNLGFAQGVFISHLLLIAFLATVVEFVSSSGWDNLSIPMVVLGSLVLLA